MFCAQIGWFLTKCHIFRGFSIFWPQKDTLKKKLKKKALLYLMNFDYLSYESNLLILGHPHICYRRGGPEPLHCISSIGVYIYILHNKRVFFMIHGYDYRIWFGCALRGHMQGLGGIPSILFILFYLFLFCTIIVHYNEIHYEVWTIILSIPEGFKTTLIKMFLEMKS